MPTGYPKNGVNAGWFKPGVYVGKGFKKGIAPWNKGKQGAQVAWNKGKCSPLKGQKKGPHSEATKEKIRQKRLQGIAEGRIKSWNKGKTDLPPPWNKGMVGAQKAWNKGLTRLTDARVQKYILTGEGHPQWKGGVTDTNKKVRNSVEMAQWRTAVFKRDAYTCIFCGVSNRKGLGVSVKLQADHIKPFAHYPELRFEVANGRTLCVSCHRTTPTWGKRTVRV